MNPNLLLLLIAVFGFLVHALSTDGGGSVLMYLGVPASVAIPKWAINPLILLAGLADAIFQGVEKGLTWQDAATQGALASLLALGGAIGSQHTLGRDAEGHSMPVTPPKGGLVVLLALGFALGTTGCAALAQDAKFLPTPAQSECVLNGVDQGLPALTIVTSCGLEMNAIAFIESLLVGKKRQMAHRAAAEADGGTDAGADASK